MVEKPLLPLLVPDRPEDPEELLPPRPEPEELDPVPRPPPDKPEPPAEGVDVLEKLLFPLVPSLLADKPEDPELLPRPVPEEAEGVELDETLLPPLAPEPGLREPLPWPPLSELDGPAGPPPTVFAGPEPADGLLE